MKQHPQQHTLTVMRDGRLLGVTDDGTWWLWNYDPQEKEVVRGPALQSGRWSTIDTQHRLCAMDDGRVLDWVPRDGSWRLWDYQPERPDVLTGPVASGRWATIGLDHELLPLPGGTVLDWSRGDGTWRLWVYDAGDEDPNRARGHRRIPGQPWDVLTGPAETGTWTSVRPGAEVRVPPDHRLLVMTDGTVFDWAPGGQWCSWALADLLAPGADHALDGTSPTPRRRGRWGSIRGNHELIPTRDGKVIDWVPLTGDYWLWDYRAADFALVGFPALQSGVWRSLNELPDVLQFRLRYMREIDSNDDFFQGANDEVFISAVGLDSAMVTQAPDGRPVAATLSSPVHGDISDDAVRDGWRNHPLVLLEFDVHRPTDWPRSFSVTLLLVERDNERLKESFDKLVGEVGDTVKNAAVAAASTAVGAVLGSAILPGVGTAVGAAVGALAGAAYDGIVRAISDGLGNDAFTPVVRVLQIDDPRTMWLHPEIGRQRTVRIGEKGAVYEIDYDWSFG